MIFIYIFDYLFMLPIEVAQFIFLPICFDDVDNVKIDGIYEINFFYLLNKFRFLVWQLCHDEIQWHTLLIGKNLYVKVVSAFCCPITQTPVLRKPKFKYIYMNKMFTFAIFQQVVNWHLFPTLLILELHNIWDIVLWDTILFVYVPKSSIGSRLVWAYSFNDTFPLLFFQTEF